MGARLGGEPVLRRESRRLGFTKLIIIRERS